MTKKDYIKYREALKPLSEFIRERSTSGDNECAMMMMQLLTFMSHADKMFGWEYDSEHLGKIIKYKGLTESEKEKIRMILRESELYRAMLD